MKDYSSLLLSGELTGISTEEILKQKFEHIVLPNPLVSPLKRMKEGLEKE